MVKYSVFLVAVVLVCKEASAGPYKIPPRCPTNNEPTFGICRFDPNVNCLEDSQCKSGQLCCPDGCNKICKNPDNGQPPSTQPIKGPSDGDLVQLPGPVPGPKVPGPPVPNPNQPSDGQFVPLPGPVAGSKVPQPKRDANDSPVPLPYPVAGRPVPQPQPSNGQLVDLPQPVAGRPVPQPNNDSPVSLPYPVAGPRVPQPQPRPSDGFVPLPNPVPGPKVPQPPSSGSGGLVVKQCPKPSGSFGICVYDESINCLSDDECKNGQMCCSEGCNKVCKDPVTFEPVKPEPKVPTKA